MSPNPLDSTRVTGKGTLVQRLRLWSGLVVLSYVTLHFLNHALGHISLPAMETGAEWMEFVWASWPGIIVLYASLVTHAALGLWKVIGLRTWRLPAWEWAQIALGLSIPWLLVSHIVFTRGAESLLGVEVGYEQELALLWPDVWIRQNVLLLVTWLHGFMGLHYWLRIRRTYPAWQPWLVAAGVLVPLLAITGWVAAARRQFDALQQAAGPAGDGARVSGEQENLNRFILEALGQLEAWSQWAVLGLVALALSIMAARWAASRMRRKVRITYGDGTVVTCPPGMTILEISRSRGIPHMSVCGGRARCSTCRTLVRAEDGALTPPTEPEAALLRRLNADPGIRLGCQARVRSDIEVRPLIQPQAISAAIRQADPLGWGVEREVALLFLDIRGFSRISEKSLPYDVVFILNSLFAEVGAEIEAANGYIDKFMGDGLMAIFGLASTPAEAARDAVRAALAAQDAARHASRILTLHLPEPLRIGIGIHVGQAVIGRIGRTSDQTSPPRLTAIGDTVNIAARLEAATKELQAGVVISAKTLQTGGIEIREDIGERAEIMVHNISRPVDVVAIRDHSALRRELGFDARMPGETDRFRRRGSGNSIALVGGDGAADRG